MPYLGNAPSAAFQSVAYQDLTGGTGTSFTLSHAVSSAQELEIFVNNVRQEPTVAYTVAGTALTMTGTIAATDDFYVVFQGKAVGSVSHPTTSPLAATTGNFSGNVTSSGTVTATSFSGDGSALTGISSAAGSEYFQVNLTTDQTGLTISTPVTVDFGGSGTVEYDTASNFDSANDAYLLNSSNGVYQISFSVGIRSDVITTEKIACSAAVVQIATDGTSFTPYKGSAQQSRDGSSHDEGSVLMANSFIYKATTATTKLRLVAFSVQASSQTWNIETVAGGMMQSTDAAVTDAHVTFMSVMRIA